MFFASELLEARLQLRQLLLDVEAARGHQRERGLRVGAGEALAQQLGLLRLDLLPKADEQQVDVAPDLARHPRLDRGARLLRRRRWRATHPLKLVRNPVHVRVH
eukprot:2586069-Prymnesium_polylepis.1